MIESSNMKNMVILKNLPSNIDVSSIKKIAEDLTYRVYKKNK